MKKIRRPLRDILTTGPPWEERPLSQEQESKKSPPLPSLLRLKDKILSLSLYIETLKNNSKVEKRNTSFIISVTALQIPLMAGQKDHIK